MRKTRIIKWTLLSLLLILLAGGLTVYLLACHKPGDYRPRSLSAQQKQAARERLGQTVTDFLRSAGETSWTSTQPLDPTKHVKMTVTQDELSEWIASLPDEALAELEKMGLSKPAMALDNDRLTFYAFWAEYDKVVGIDFNFRFDDKGLMTIDVKAVRLGDLPMPRDFVDKKVNKLSDYIKSHMDDNASGEEGKIGPVPIAKARKAVLAVIDAVSGKPIVPEFRESWGHVRITGITLQKELATLDVVPAASQPAQPAQLGAALRHGARTMLALGMSRLGHGTGG